VQLRARLLWVTLLAACAGCGDATGDGETGPASCKADADCKDDDPCSTETCVDGTCAFEEAPDGDAAEADQVAGDCVRIACKGGRADYLADDGDIDDDHEPCTLDLCEGGTPSHLAQIDQVPCQVGLGEGFCVNAVCIVSCNTEDADSACDDLRPCTEDACLGGTCGHRDVEGTAPEAYQTEGDCLELRCVDGEEAPVPDDEDAPQTSNPCIVSTCSSGELVEELVPEGQLAATDPEPGDCSGYLCDGNGGPTSEVDDGDVPDDDNECTIDACQDGSPTFIPEPPETPCGDGNVCNGGGTCCVPITCADVEVECGPVNDGCNGTIVCGGCNAPEWCGGSGGTNSCGCSPTGQRGPNVPREAWDDDAVGNLSWGLVPNLFEYDGSTAVARDLAAGDQTHWLRASDFDFDVPSFATITGIQVTWRRNGGDALVDRGVRLARRGTLVGVDRAIGTPWGGVDFGLYGGADDLWDTTWTPADIDDPGFGTALSVGHGDEGGSASAHVDTAQVTVFFEVDCE
jgi:hypothetical protein